MYVVSISNPTNTIFPWRVIYLSFFLPIFFLPSENGISFKCGVIAKYNHFLRTYLDMKIKNIFILLDIFKVENENEVVFDYSILKMGCF